MFLVHLFLLLLEPSLWWLIAGSPTDDNTLRSGHGEQGEPGHNEHHKDSYSTFASEFLESRYLSDEGNTVPCCIIGFVYDVFGLLLIIIVVFL